MKLLIMYLPPFPSYLLSQCETKFHAHIKQQKKITVLYIL